MDIITPCTTDTFEIRDYWEELKWISCAVWGTFWWMKIYEAELMLKTMQNGKKHWMNCWKHIYQIFGIFCQKFLWITIKKFLHNNNCDISNVCSMVPGQPPPHYCSEATGRLPLPAEADAEAGSVLLATLLLECYVLCCHCDLFCCRVEGWD